MADNLHHDGRKRPSRTLDQADLTSSNPLRQYLGPDHLNNNPEHVGNGRPFLTRPFQNLPHLNTQNLNSSSAFQGYTQSPQQMPNGPSPASMNFFPQSQPFEAHGPQNPLNSAPPTLQPSRSASGSGDWMTHPFSFAPDWHVMPFPLTGHPDMSRWQQSQRQQPNFESTRPFQPTPQQMPYGLPTPMDWRYFHNNAFEFPRPNGWNVPLIPRQSTNPPPNQVVSSGRPMAVPKSRKAKAKPAEPPKERCVACFEEWKTSEIVTLPCGCKYNHQCLEELVRSHCTPLDFPPKCHGTPVRLNVYGTLLSDDTVAKYKKAEAERNVKNLFYCARPTCSASLTEDTRLTLLSHTFRRCRKCDESTCEKCRQPINRHKMEQPAQTIKCCSEPKELSALRKLGEKERWKQCPSCGHYIEKEDGCDHIECYCGIEFCYKCGGLFDEYDDCKCVTSDSEDDTDDEWPNHLSAVDRVGRQICHHTGASRQTGTRCHGCLKVPANLSMMYSCPDCDVELCYNCFDEIWMAEFGTHLENPHV